jgi:hypothetical protein
VPMPTTEDGLAVRRVSYFGNWLRVAADFAPGFHTQFNEVLTKANLLGVKGVGEAGTVGALPAVMNATNDALASAGAPEIDRRMTLAPSTTGRTPRCRGSSVFCNAIWLTM